MTKNGLSPFPGLTVTGTLRGYDFQRLNTPEYNGAAKPAATGPNRQAVNFGGDIRAEYKIMNTGLSVGGAFWGAYPFGLNGGSVGCNVGGGLIVQQPAAQCAANSAGIDNSLPGFPLETFEYYIKYADPSAQIAIGNQLLNKPWLPSSDSRIKPALYQGADATFNVTKNFSIGATAITRFENRTESQFNDCTLITCNITPVGVGGAGGVSGVKGITGGSRFGPTVPLTTGADRVAIGFKNANLATIAEVYRFHNIADLTYFESKYNFAPKSVFNPFVAGQFVNERNSGQSVVGNILNQTYGIQLGVNATKTINLTVAADQSPWQYADVYAPSAAVAASQYWTPVGGTNTPLGVGPNGSVNGKQLFAQPIGAGRYRVAYGGIASPYSDSYATDPLYVESLTQGVVDRRSPGTFFKGTIGYTSLTKRVVFLTSAAIYNYDSPFVQQQPALRNRAYEYDADLTLTLAKGLSLRTRAGSRFQPTLPYNFKYIREQLQFQF